MLVNCGDYVFVAILCRLLVLFIRWFACVCVCCLWVLRWLGLIALAVSVCISISCLGACLRFGSMVVVLLVLVGW